MTWRGLMVASLLAVLSITASVAYANGKPFGVWVEKFSERAVNEGIPPELVADVFRNVTVDLYVVKLDRKQPEDKLSFSKYKSNTVSQRRINKGRVLLQEHAALLQKISDTYDVEPRFIVALWGMETDYGAHTGNFSVIQSLATLAYDGRREELFTSELIAAFKILQSGQFNQFDLVGSWAGAMGNCQFMPSSYLKFAVDWDKSGKADIWNSLPDTFASIANYLHQSGWKKGIGWGEPSSAADAIYPGTPQEGGYRITSNYDVIMKWNRSRYFATSVGLLSDALGQ